jgi:hypothetical protein
MHAAIFRVQELKSLPLGRRKLDQLLEFKALSADTPCTLRA